MNHLCLDHMFFQAIPGLCHPSLWAVLVHGFFYRLPSSLSFYELLILLYSILFDLVNLLHPTQHPQYTHHHKQTSSFPPLFQCQEAKLLQSLFVWVLAHHESRWDSWYYILLPSFLSTLPLLEWTSIDSKCWWSQGWCMTGVWDVTHYQQDSITLSVTQHSQRKTSL